MFNHLYKTSKTLLPVHDCESRSVQEGHQIMGKIPYLHHVKIEGKVVYTLDLVKIGTFTAKLV